MRARAGVDYPKTFAECRAWFDEDWKCRDYLEWLRWPDGFVCPHCQGLTGWRLADGRLACADCARKVSVTAGTIMDSTRTPLTLWLAAAWLITTSKSGISASALHRELDVGSYQTAWAMLHRFRSVMVIPGRDLLTGRVEVDETVLGGPEPGVRGRGALGKVLIAVAVEVPEDPNAKGFGRCRLQLIDNASTASLRGFLNDHVAEGATVVTDGWRAYPAATKDRYTHEAINISASAAQAHELLPAVHSVASLLKRWILGTLHGSLTAEHLPAYLDEFTFRFNRRRSASRGLLFHRLLTQAVAGDPITYADLRKAGRTRPPPPPPVRARNNPASLDLGDVGLPWRDHQPSSG